jgi:hypothetical protein
MMVDLKRIIANWWERSGQGDGGLAEPEGGSEDGSSSSSRSGECSATSTSGGAVRRFGTLIKRKRDAMMDQVHSFAPSSQSYLLYLWRMLDKHGLLGSSLQRLDDEISKSVPSVLVGGVATVASGWWWC